MSQPVHTSSESPRNNVEWVEAIVKWSRYEYVAVYDYPATSNSEAIMGIYKGDMVQISRRYRREDWCLCQIGHVLGWVFLDDVRFLVRGARPPRSKTRTQQIPKPTYRDTSEIEAASVVIDRTEIDMDMDTRQALRGHIATPTYPDPNEVETKPIPTFEELQLDETCPANHQPILKPETGEPEPIVAEAPTAKKSLINRMIKFFQR
ncbi:MAG: hypothetical protein WBC91_06800 [Phototrophicaceae bacterium]